MYMIFQVAYGWLSWQHAHAGLGVPPPCRKRMGLADLLKAFGMGPPALKQGAPRSAALHACMQAFCDLDC